MSLTYEQLVAAWSAGRLMREEVIAWFQDHRWLQHQALFAHRHSCEPALFHRELVEAFWSEARRIGVFAFRGGAKSTIAEEFIARDRICAGSRTLKLTCNGRDLDQR